MEKVVNEKGELVLVRQPWMQQVMTYTYNFLVIAALAKGTLDGAWEYEISEHLKSLWKGDYGINRQLIRELLDETGKDGLNAQFEAAGYLIVNSKIMESK